MKQKLAFSSLLLALSLASALTARAITTWYVDGVNGSDSNNCVSSLTACKTIGHAISLASSGDSIMVAAATYKENLSIGFSLNVVGSGAGTPIIDGRSIATVLTVSNANAHVTLSKLIIQNGFAHFGGGINNNGTLTISNSTITQNLAGRCGFGGGIYNSGALIVNSSTISQNSAGGTPFKCYGTGGGIYNRGTVEINNSTVSENQAINWGWGGGINNGGTLAINNSTISENSAIFGPGGLIGPGTLQNSIVASNSRANCGGAVVSRGYNLSSDRSCNFSNSGDRNNIDPKLGTLGNYGGPTRTIPLLLGSPAIDAGNPSGCTDGRGHLLKTDQRGQPRPDHEDKRGCDMGAYERQSD
jgi:hypothetical protein